MAPRRGGGGALRSASATVYPPPPSPAGGVDQSLAGARSIRGDDLRCETPSATVHVSVCLCICVSVCLCVCLFPPAALLHRQLPIGGTLCHSLLCSLAQRLHTVRHSDEEMLAPIRFVGRWGLALIAFLTLLVLGALERFSQFLAGSSQHPCELRVRAVLDPFWTVALAYAVFAIGAAVFLFLWEVRQSRPRSSSIVLVPFRQPGSISR
jgi:hypothetical protein